MPSDTSEKGLESIIVASLVSVAGYLQGNPHDYEREHAVDLSKLSAFVQNTQPKAFDALSLSQDSPRRTRFLHRLQGEIAKRGVTVEDAVQQYKRDRESRDTEVIKLAFANY